MSRIWGKVKTYVASAISGLYTKPSGGIPKSDLSTEVQTSLGKADTAIQSHQDISGKQDVISDLATIRSGAALGATAIQQHQDISGKQDVISDLATIRSWASAGATALQPNDLADWAKQPTRPTYTANDTGALPNTTTLADLEDATHKTVTPTEKETWNGKQDAIADLADIRSGAALGATALQEHQDISGKQDLLVSGTNIKTINNESIVGSGNIAIGGGGGIHFGSIDAGSTASEMIATVDGVTELADGVIMYITNTVIKGNSSFTLNVNSLGAKPVYASNAASSRVGSNFEVNRSYLLFYDSTKVSGGCWVFYVGEDNDTHNERAYIIRGTGESFVAKETLYRTAICFTYSDTEILPSAKSNSYQTNKELTALDFNPFGRIYVWDSTTSVTAGDNVNGVYLYFQEGFDLRYAFNTGDTLTQRKSVYVKCEPLVDDNRTGRVRLATGQPIVQDLPTTADGYVYIFLGIATSTRSIHLRLEHPVYEYRNGGIKLWIGD